MHYLYAYNNYLLLLSDRLRIYSVTF